MKDATQLYTAAMVVFAAASILTAAIVLLFYGWKVYKVFAAIFFCLFLGVIGWFYVAPEIITLGMPAKYGFVAPLVLGVVGIAVAIPLQRVAAFAITGALGAVIAAVSGMRYLDVPLDLNADKFLITVAAGFIVAGVLGAVFYRFIVVVLTSAYGATLAMSGAAMVVLVCLSRWPSAEILPTAQAKLESIETLDTNAMLAGLAGWGALMIGGMVYQYRTMEAPKGKKAKPKEEKAPKSRK